MSDRTFDYSSTQVNIEGQLKQDILEFHDKIAKSDVYSADGYGIEKEPHVTVVYGLHTKRPDGIRKLIEGNKPIKLRLGKVSRFLCKDKPYDVLKIEVESDDLIQMHKLLVNNGKITSDLKDYRPHMTLAYIKSNTCQDIVGDTTFSGRVFTSDTIKFSSSTGKQTIIKLQI